MSLKSIAIAGANGHVGSAIFNAIQKDGSFNVTVLCRPGGSSASATFDGVAVANVDFHDEAALTNAFQGKDAVILAFRGEGTQQAQQTMARASKAAGVKVFIPPDFSCDCWSDVAQSVPSVTKSKRDTLAHLKEIGQDYIDICTGSWFDFVIPGGHWGFNLKEKKAIIYGSGNVKQSSTTLNGVGKVVVHVLKNPQPALNRVIKVSELAWTQNELLDVLKKKLGGDGWEISNVSMETVQEKIKNRMLTSTKAFSTH